MLDAVGLQALLGPTVRVVAEPTLQETFYVLSSDGSLSAYVSGHRRSVPDRLAEHVKKNLFSSPKPDIAKPVKVRRSLASLPYEQRQRYEDASDILAGTKSGATAQDRKRAMRFMGVVHDWISGDLDKKDSSGG